MRQHDLTRASQLTTRNSYLTLSLLMARVTAYDKHHALAADDLALVANPFHAGSNFHRFSPHGKQGAPVTTIDYLRNM